MRGWVLRGVYREGSGHGAGPQQGQRARRPGGGYRTANEDAEEAPGAVRDGRILTRGGGEEQRECSRQKECETGTGNAMDSCPFFSLETLCREAGTGFTKNKVV